MLRLFTGRLKHQRWSPRGRRRPRGRPRRHILKSLALAAKVKSLASKPQVLKNWPVLGSRTALLFEPLKFLENARKLAENLLRPLWYSSFGDRLKKNLKTFVFVEVVLENTCARVFGPWPRAFLSLASRVSVLGRVVLGLGFLLCPWPKSLCPRLYLC